MQILRNSFDSTNYKKYFQVYSYNPINISVENNWLELLIKGIKLVKSKQFTLRILNTSNNKVKKRGCAKREILEKGVTINL